MNTGIILEIRNNQAVILKSDGTYISMKVKKRWQVGNVVPMPSVQRRQYSFIRVCAACLLIMILSNFTWSQLYASPVALISLDVNPSIELEVNRFNHIISASALNEEGVQILTETEINHSNYLDALIRILEIQEENGFLNTNVNVILTVYASDPTLRSKLLSTSKVIVDDKVTLQPFNMKAEYHEVDESIINGAHDYGVTAGKYLYLQQLQDINPETDISQHTHHSIEQIKGEIEACMTEHKEEKEQKKMPHVEEHRR